MRFTTLARVAELLGAPELAADGRGPLTRALRLESIHTVLAHDDGPLAGVSNHPATATALAATFDELAEVDADARAQLATRSDRAAAVVRLYDAYRALTSDSYDVADVFRAAADAVRADVPSAAEVGHVVLHLPEADHRRRGGAPPRPGHRATGSPRCSGSPATTRPTAASLTCSQHGCDTSLGAPVDAGAPTTAPLADRLLSAPDPDDEVRAVARELDARASRGEQLGRVAVLYRVGEPYARLVPEVFDAAGIPWTGAAPRRVADAAAGRILLGLLALADGDLAATTSPRGWRPAPCSTLPTGTA